MAFLLINFLVLIVTLPAFWWLSGFDTRVTGENVVQDRIRRGIRCGITLILIEFGFWGLWQYWRYNDRSAGMAYLASTLPLAIIWCGCVSEMVARTFTWLMDPEDKREFDPNQSLRDLDAIASLIRQGKKSEAIQLCHALKESGTVNVVTLDTMLEQLGAKPAYIPQLKPLQEAVRLRAAGKLSEAEAILNGLLLKNPENVDAAIMLIRLYAQDMGNRFKATEVLHALERQPHVSAGHIDFARRSIDEWLNPKPKEIATEKLPESLDELLAKGYFGTAVEILEQKIKDHPDDFAVRMQLIEVHGRYFTDFLKIEKIIREMSMNTHFTTEQIQQAKMELNNWRAVAREKQS